MRRLRHFTLGLILGLAGMLTGAPAQAEVKALLVGSNYAIAENKRLHLTNPIADVQMIEAALKRSAVQDVTLLEEPTHTQWETAFADFVHSLSGDDIGMLYFAGHGFQVDGANYLMSSDGTSLIPLENLVSQISAKARGTIIVIDACRSNPLYALEPEDELQIVTIEGAARQLDQVSVQEISFSKGGLAQMGNLRGLSAIVFFSTEPGNIAEDGANPGKGSPFAIEFAKAVKRRQSLDEVFRKTAIAVNARTEGRQSPWRQGDLPYNVFLSGMRALPIP